MTLLPPLAADLAEWRLVSDSRDLIFPRYDGGPWNLPNDLHNWRRRVWKKVAPEGVTPYALRHSYASLLIHSGQKSVVEIAQELGHSVSMLQSNYLHVFREAPERGAPPEELIRAAREKLSNRQEAR